MTETKEKLFQVLVDIINLLSQCGWEDKAGWFSKKLEILRSLNPQSQALEKELQEMRNILIGMGSFSDLPMYPKDGSRFTEQDARNRQWELAAKLAGIIDELLKHESN